MQNNDEQLANLFQELNHHTQTLLAYVPNIITEMKADINQESLIGFELLKQAPKKFIKINNKPLLVASLVGPSGAGKSTIFNLLTDLKVPAGGAVRPMTYGSIAAFPEEIYSNIDASEFFPSFSTNAFSVPSDLRNKNIPASQLFIAPYNNSIKDSELWLCLVDIPDFNTTEKSNWNKAKQMINRADTVIFCVYHEAYNDAKTFEILKKCCKSSGNLIYLITKLNKTNAKQSVTEIWKDIEESAKSDTDFTNKRADGRTLLEYLKSSSVYFSCYEENIGLESIHPLDNNNPSFKSLLMGQQAVKTLLRRHLQAINESLITCNIVYKVARGKIELINSLINNTENRINEKSSLIVGEEFPVFHILSLIKTLLSENRPTFIRRLFKPITMLANGIVSMALNLKNTIKGLNIDQVKQEVSFRNELEKKRLIIYCNELVDEWRNQIPELNLTANACRNSLEKFFNMELPPVDDEWDKFVREKITFWMAQKKDRWLWVSIINELILFIGTTLVIVDIFAGGGIGTLGVVAVVGGSGVVGSLLLTLFNNMGLGNEIKEAHKLWKQLRTDAYKKHLKNNLADRLFLSEYEHNKRKIDENKLEKVIIACQKLEDICNNYE